MLWDSGHPGDVGGSAREPSHAYNVRDVHLIWLPTDPKWDPLRHEASFVRLLERCGFRDSSKRP